VQKLLSSFLQYAVHINEGLTGLSIVAGGMFGHCVAVQLQAGSALAQSRLNESDRERCHWSYQFVFVDIPVVTHLCSGGCVNSLASHI
jgi:hypothetical protein